MALVPESCLLRQESDLFWLLGSLTASAPEKELLASLLTELEKTTVAASPLEVAFQDALKDALSCEEIFIKIQQDYVNLLACVRERPDIPAPMQSVAQTGHGDPGALHAHLITLFQRGRFQPPEEHTHAPDHLSTLLLLLSVLRRHQAESLERNDLDQAHLEDLYFYTLRNHILPWAPEFIDKALSQCQSGFYRAVLGMLCYFFDQLKEEV